MKSSNINKRSSPLVITVTGGKGGIGKSNIALNLALALQQYSQVVLFDANLGLANINVLLGFDVKHTLSSVLKGESDLSEVVVTTKEGLRIIPASSGNTAMVHLSERELGGIINVFSTLGGAIDYLIIDTAAGIAKSVGYFAAASNEVIVILCNEPTALTDAYTLINVFNKEYNISRYRILINMVDNEHIGRKLYTKFAKVTEQLLDVSIQYMGYVPYDELLQKSVQQQKSFFSRYPSSRISKKFDELANQIMHWQPSLKISGGLEFFLERRLANIV